MKIKFVKQDLWIGLYWKQERLSLPPTLRTTFYLCIVPCFPIIWINEKRILYPETPEQAADYDRRSVW